MRWRRRSGRRPSRLPKSGHPTQPFVVSNALTLAGHTTEIQESTLPSIIPEYSKGICILLAALAHRRTALKGKEIKMIIRNGLFSSESVSEGHPDKLADRISDRILDAFLERDPKARVACETVLADQFVVVAGEFKTRNPDDFEAVRSKAEHLVRDVLRSTGYTTAESGIDPDRCEVQIRFNRQSANISQGVDRIDGELGAGDQGLMFGYATDETPELMPAPILYAHLLVRRHAEVRRSGNLPWLRPDAKSQVTFQYRDGEPVSVETVVLSTQHEEGTDRSELIQEVERHIIDPVIPAELRGPDFRVFVNPAGPFITGGPKGDTGLTGRKIIVDTYGGAVPHGGGAFSGKDPSKVDRSAAYMARYLAKTVVARGWARRALVQIAYAIGVAKPVSFMVETFGTGIDHERDLKAELERDFDVRPQGIIETLNLLRPIYFPIAAYGHFGRTDLNLPWELTRA
jgi:S-adenosylmethionine synthetase